MARADDSCEKQLVEIQIEMQEHRRSSWRPQQNHHRAGEHNLGPAILSLFPRRDERGAAQNEKDRRQRIHRYEMRRGAFQNLNMEQPTNKTRLPMK